MSKFTFPYYFNKILGLIWFNLQSHQKGFITVEDTSLTLILTGLYVIVLLLSSFYGTLFCVLSFDIFLQKVKFISMYCVFVILYVNGFIQRKNHRILIEKLQYRQTHNICYKYYLYQKFFIFCYYLLQHIFQNFIIHILFNSICTVEIYLQLAALNSYEIFFVFIITEILLDLKLNKKRKIRIDEATQVLRKIEQMYTENNNVYQIPLFTHLGSHFLSLLLSYNLILINYLDVFNDLSIVQLIFTYLFVLCWSTGVIYELFVVIYVNEKLNKEIKRFVERIENALDPPNILQLRYKQKELFYLQNTLNGVSFMACSMFEVNWKVIFMMFTSLCDYFIILIQFHQMNKL